MKKIFLLLVISILSLTFLNFNPKKAKADIGPKPDTEIIIYNLDKSDYIVGYLTKFSEWMGPHHTFIPNNEEFGFSNFGDIDDLTFLYNNVSTIEGWYLLDISYSFKNSTELVIESGYMWPSEFILIVYDKLNNIYYLSEPTKTYAFHSYFKYDMNKYEKEMIFEKNIELEKSYDYKKEILEFFLRLVLTLLIEIGLALIFKFDKKSILIILIVNAITQVGLNLGLNLTAHYNGKNQMYIFIYAFIELLIMCAESIIYRIFCKRKDSKKWIILYGVISNVLSFALGMILWLYI